jgi:cyclase
MHRSLIVARFDPGHAGVIADIFAESDATELPHRLGASSRTLFRFHDLYLHLIEAEQDIGAGVAALRDDPQFQEVNAKLSPYVRAYSPDWRGPRDAMAQPFYSWEAERWTTG